VLEDGRGAEDFETFQEAVNPVSIVPGAGLEREYEASGEQVMAAARAFVEILRPEDSLAVFRLR